MPQRDDPRYKKAGKDSTGDTIPVPEPEPEVEIDQESESED